MKLPFEIVDNDRRHARVTMRAALAQCNAPDCAPASEPGARLARFGVADGEPTWGSSVDITPNDADYIYPLFRALSATTIEGYWIDYSRPGVLQDSTPLLARQTVYADHHFWNVERWLGVVNEAMWDDAGEHSEGIPGINVELKIDAYLNPRIARGLLMQPPAIHSASVTVLFEYEYSHPDLIEDGRFWDLLGEEVEGSIVRLIATKILGYWELSLVFQGADRSAKQLPQTAAGLPSALPNYNVEPDASDPDVEDHLTVVADPAKLAAEAQAGHKLLSAARDECRRLAALATLGADEGELPAALGRIIEQADAEQLAELTDMYRDQSARRFARGRSSIEPVIAVGGDDRVGETTLL
ncbi:MAG: hypothetical protein ABIP75_11765 [Pyrinomonadaceae bacterium]